MTVDNGGAPCVKDGLLSLAICKPMIRSKAERGDLIFGFAANSLDRHNPLIYIARVTEKPKVGKYYRKRRFAHRPDCIYHEVHGRAERKAKAKYHTDSDQRKRDVGLHFENAHVLLSQDFRYFGKKGTDEYKDAHPEIAGLIQTLKRGHRVNLPQSVRRALVELRKQVWRIPHMKIGSPTDSDKTNLCNEDSPSARC